jgi:hypothetical protein
VVLEVVLDEVGRGPCLDRPIALPEIVVDAGDDQIIQVAGLRSPGRIDRVDDRLVLDPPQQQRILRRLAVLGRDDESRGGL